MTTVQREALRIFRWQRPILMGSAVSMLLLVLSALLIDHGRTQFFRSYLLGAVFITSIALGSVGVLAMQYLTGGQWGVAIRKSLEAAARTLPLVALAFLPVLFGLHDLYEWTHDEVVAHDPVLQTKVRYLNEPFFIARTAAYFLIWIGIAYFLTRWGREYEETASPSTAVRIGRMSAGGLLVLALTLTFASVDWMMSLEPHWYSTMYGISFLVGCLLAAMAFASLVASLLTEYEPLAEIFSPRTYRDLGNLMLALVMMWAYTAFSQYMLIWYGNLREEVPYYIPRTQGGWGVVAAMLIVFHFFLPFGLLLMREIKDRPRTLGFVAALILVMRIVDHFWIIAPAFREHGEHAGAFRLHWMDLLAVIGLTGLWVALFLWQLEKRPLLPRGEPVAQEILSHG